MWTPAAIGAARHPKTATLDANREQHRRSHSGPRFEIGKPVLAICFGCQLLNVYLQGHPDPGHAVQSGPSSVPHGDTDLPPGARQGDLRHEATFELRQPARLAQSGGTAGTINSSHHQAIEKPGEDLRCHRACSRWHHRRRGVDRGPNWVVGVQWHPERMPGDALARRAVQRICCCCRAGRNARDLVGAKA